MELRHLEAARAAKWTYYYLYVILDVFSRYAVGWTVQHREAASVAEALIAQACEQQQITRGRLTVHADRGSSMTSKPVALLLCDLGVTKTHSRPYTSTDNPYSEAQSKTLKYRPGFPQRFDSIEHAREFCRDFFDWYNHQHRHSGLGLMTPTAVHHGQAQALHAERQRVLAAVDRGRPRCRRQRGSTSPRQKRSLTKFESSVAWRVPPSDGQCASSTARTLMWRAPGGRVARGGRRWGGWPA
jgi:putative transposase